jgi:hypothetical protein
MLENGMAVCRAVARGTLTKKGSRVVGRDCRGPILQTSPVRERGRRGSEESEERLVEERERESLEYAIFLVSTARAVQRQCFVAD